MKTLKLGSTINLERITEGEILLMNSNNPALIIKKGKTFIRTIERGRFEGSIIETKRLKSNYNSQKGIWGGNCVLYTEGDKGYDPRNKMLTESNL